MIHTDIVRAGLDITSLGIMAAWWLDRAPKIATIMTIIWLSFCLIEGLHKFWKWLNK